MFSGQSPPGSKTRRSLTEVESQECMRVLTEVFHHATYKGKQKEIIEAAHAGADVLVVAPTGMGKSLCFQIPAVADRRGLSIVISPLLALMQNQLDGLRQRNIEVAALHSQVPHVEQGQIKKQLQDYDTQIKLLYATPERMCNQEFMQLLDVVYNNHNLNRLVIDEAHCISEWGHNFRDDYRRLGRFRDRYPDVPIMALTATATPIVQRDIIRSLKLDPKHLFEALHPFNRSNLFYEVRYLSNPTPLQQMAEITEYIAALHRRRGKPSSGIIYCRYRKTCDELAEFMQKNGLNARPYHRGVPASTLEKTLKGWTNGVRGSQIDIVVATIAFGLGIDKGDVRYIIHYDLPKSFEGYYQETGRAGRDGHPSKCILYYSREDAIRVKRFVHSSDSSRPRDMDYDEPTPTQRASGSLDALIQYAETASLCRHITICRYFGECIDEKNKDIVEAYCNSMCDICKYPDKTKARISRLSSDGAATTNVPFSRTGFTTPDTGSSSRSRVPGDWQNNQRQRSLQARASNGAQKRGPNIADTEGFDRVAAKKPKTAMPMLVTRPFNSTAGLSKPFRPPAFVERSAKAVSNEATSLGNFPSQKQEELSSKSLAPPSPADEPAEDVHQELEEDLPIVLPHVDIAWEPEQSAKAMLSDRQKVLISLRSGLHKILMLSHEKEEMWDKISSRLITDGRKSEIIFRVAIDLEAAILLLSSTLSGYRERVEWKREDIMALSDLDGWDGDDPKFDDPQEIIQSLRQYALSSTTSITVA